jgi:hypothetical protein
VSRLLAAGFLGVLVAEVLGVLVGWRWALPAAGGALALFAWQVRGHLAGVHRAWSEEPASDPALESLYRWKAQTDSLLQWSDTTRGDWDRYLRPKLARDFLQATRQKEPAAVAAAGRLLFGEDLWQWVDPQNVSSARRNDPGPGRATLDTILERLEHS